MNFGKAYSIMLKFYFAHHKHFLDFIEGYIKSNVESFGTANHIDESLAKENPEYYYSLVDEISEKWWQHSRDFPSEFRTTFLAQVFSGIDAHLNIICAKFHRIHLPPKEVKSMNGSEWSKKGKYLKKFASVDFFTIQKEWDLLEQIRQIRNLVIHHHSSVSANDKDWLSVKTFIKKNSNYIIFKDDIEELDETGKLIYDVYPGRRFDFLIPTSDLNRLLLLTAENFFDKLLPLISFEK